jgi:hypothetical protein
MDWQIWKTLRDHSNTIEGKGQLIMQAFAKVNFSHNDVPPWCH